MAKKGITYKMKFIKELPLALSGLSLAIASLGNLLRSIPGGEIIRLICGILSAAILILFILKVILDSKNVKEELKAPLPLSVLPTSTMALMNLCTYIMPFAGIFAVALWYAAALVHVCIVLVFFKRFLLGFKLESVYPSWFIVFVGLAAASITGPAVGAFLVGRASFYVGFALYFVALVLIICRMLKQGQLPERARPTIAIFTAPMGLLTVGYVNSYVQQGQANETLIYIMLSIAAMSYIFVTVMMFSLLRIKFYPTYAAFTFPYVISATAFRFGTAFLSERGIQIAPVAIITQWIAVAVVFYVLLRYIIHYSRSSA